MFTFDACAFLVPVQAQGYCGVIGVQSSKKIIHIFQRSVAFLSRRSPPSPVVAMIHYAIFKYNLLFLRLEPERNQMVPEVLILWQANVM